MADPTHLLARVPRWVLRPLSAHAAARRDNSKRRSTRWARTDSRPHRRLGIISMHSTLDRGRDVPRVRLGGQPGRGPRLARAGARPTPAAHPATAEALARFAGRHLVGRARACVLRRLAKDPDLRVRRVVRAEMELRLPDEVALPAPRRPMGRHGLAPRPRAPAARRPAPTRSPVSPPPKGVAADTGRGGGSRRRTACRSSGRSASCEQLLGIRSAAQLGYLLAGLRRRWRPLYPVHDPQARRYAAGDLRAGAPVAMVPATDPPPDPRPRAPAPGRARVRRGPLDGDQRRAAPRGRGPAEVRPDRLLPDTPLLPGDGPVRVAGLPRRGWPVLQPRRGPRSCPDAGPALYLHHRPATVRRRVHAARGADLAGPLERGLSDPRRPARRSGPP